MTMHELVVPDLAPLLATLATAVGGTANASMALAGAVGVTAAAVTKGGLSLWRRGSRRRACDKMVTAQARLGLVRRSKTELEKKHEGQKRSLMRAKKSRNDAIASDTTGSVYEPQEVDADEEDADSDESDEADGGM